MAEYTYITREFLNETAGAGSPTQLHQEIDLGLGMDQVARILAVHMGLLSGIEPITANTGHHSLEGWVSLNPEQVQWYNNRDEQFVSMLLSLVNVATVTISEYGVQRALNLNFDFLEMNLITSRNLSFGVRCRSDMATKPEGECHLMVFWEKFKPSANELNQLISARR